MKVYIANFGRQNYEWPICRERGTVATMNAIDAQKLWESNDRESYIASRMANETTASGKTPTKATASRWFNLMTTVVETVGDVWVHKDGKLDAVKRRLSAPIFNFFYEKYVNAIEVHWDMNPVKIYAEATEGGKYHENGDRIPDRAPDEIGRSLR